MDSSDSDSSDDNFNDIPLLAQLRWLRRAAENRDNSDEDSSSDDDNSASEDNSNSSSDEESSSEEEDQAQPFFRNVLSNLDKLWIRRRQGRNMNVEDWEQLGHDAANNTDLKDLFLGEGVLNEQKMTSFFRGLTGSNSIETIRLMDNDSGVEGVRSMSMVQFLQNTSNLKKLIINRNNIGSEGFSSLLRALRDSPITTLACNNTGIESIHVDNIDHTPKNLLNLNLSNNNIDAEGCREIARLWQGKASTLTIFGIHNNNIQSEGFNLLWRALRDSPIEHFGCSNCGIDSIEIDDDHIPKNLKGLDLHQNNINTDGCRELAKLLLKGRDSMVEMLHLENNNIDDEGIGVLVNALQNNTSLKRLYLMGNNISLESKASLLKLVNDISSIKATLNSNHTLQKIQVVDEGTIGLLQHHIDANTKINRENENNPMAAGRAKVIHTQLDSTNRAELARLQGVDRSLYSEIDTLHLPEVLALVGKSHGHSEFFLALQSSVTGLISTVNKKQCIQQQRDYHLAKAAELDAELEAMEEAERIVVVFGSDCRKNKRRRT
jgi:hypothetical protein